jgi:hypothetical protein
MASFWRAFQHNGKSAQPGEGEGCTPSPMKNHVVMYSPAARADTLPLFLLYPYMYSVGGIADLDSALPLPFPLYDSPIDQVFFFASAHIPGVPQFRSNPHTMQMAQS